MCPVWAPHFRKAGGKLKGLQNRVTKIRELGPLPWENQLKELGLFSLEKRFMGDMIALLKYLRRCQVEERFSLFYFTQKGRNKSRKGDFCSIYDKNILRTRAVQNYVLGEWVSPLLQAFLERLNGHFSGISNSHELGHTALHQGSVLEPACTGLQATVVQFPMWPFTLQKLSKL